MSQQSFEKTPALTKTTLKRIKRFLDEVTLRRILENDPTLTRLILKSKNLNDEDAVALANVLSRNTHVTMLDVSYNNIRTIGAEALATNTVLKSVNIFYNKIGAKGAIAFIKNPTLTSLDVGANSDSHKIVKAFMANTTLTSFNMAGVSSDDDSFFSSSRMSPIEATQAINTTLLRNQRAYYPDIAVTVMLLLAIPGEKLRPLAVRIICAFAFAINQHLQEWIECDSTTTVDLLPIPSASEAQSSTSTLSIPDLFKSLVNTSKKTSESVPPMSQELQKCIEKTITFFETRVKEPLAHRRQVHSDVAAISTSNLLQSLLDTFKASSELVATESVLNLLTAYSTSEYHPERSRYKAYVAEAIELFKQFDDNTLSQQTRIIRLLLIVEGRLHCYIKQLSVKSDLRQLITAILVKFTNNPLTEDLLKFFITIDRTSTQRAFCLAALKDSHYKQLWTFLDSNTLTQLVAQNYPHSELYLSNRLLTTSDIECLQPLLELNLPLLPRFHPEQSQESIEPLRHLYTTGAAPSINRG